MVTDTKLSPEEARQAILDSKSLSGKVIEGFLYPGGATVEGDLDLRDVTIKGFLHLDYTPVEGDLDLRDVTIKGNLQLGGATIEGVLYLSGATIKGNLDLATKSGPTKIFVSPEIAERVHWAAPNIPLVVVKPSD